MSRKVLQNSNL